MPNFRIWCRIWCRIYQAGAEGGELKLLGRKDGGVSDTVTYGVQYQQYCTYSTWYKPVWSIFSHPTQVDVLFIACCWSIGNWEWIWNWLLTGWQLHAWFECKLWRKEHASWKSTMRRRLCICHYWSWTTPQRKRDNHKWNRKKGFIEALIPRLGSSFLMYTPSTGVDCFCTAPW